MSNCEHGWRGDCCCNCTHQVKVNKHPLNRLDAKGSIMEQLGWVCTVFNKTEGHPFIFFDREHGMCELHTPKTNDNE